MPGGALEPLLFFFWVSVTWSLNACFNHHKPMKTSLIKAVGRKAEQGIQISLFCPSEVAALHCPPHLPDKATNLWLPGTPEGAGSWSGMSLKGACVVASHEDKGGEPREGVIDADGFGMAHGGMAQLQEGQCDRRDSATGGTVLSQEGQCHRRVCVSGTGRTVLSQEGQCHRRDSASVTGGTASGGLALPHPCEKGSSPSDGREHVVLKNCHLYGGLNPKVYASKTSCFTTTVRSQTSILACILPCSCISESSWHLWKLTPSASGKAHQDVLIPLHFASTLESGSSWFSASVSQNWPYFPVHCFPFTDRFHRDNTPVPPSA